MRLALVLNPEDARRVAEIRERYDLPHDGAAMRLALRVAHERMRGFPEDSITVVMAPEDRP